MKLSQLAQMHFRSGIACAQNWAQILLEMNKSWKAGVKKARSPEPQDGKRAAQSNTGMMEVCAATDT